MATLAHPIPEKDDALLTFEDFNEELEYLRCENARLEKQCKIEHLRTPVLGKATH